MNDPNDVTVENAFPEASRRVGEARRLLIEAMEIHRRFCPDPACQETANALAFLAHSIGATAHDLRVFPRLLLDYDFRCKQNGGCDLHGAGERTIDLI